jgi:GH15 family glucan-1,4-alpha-glucosidase
VRSIQDRARALLRSSKRVFRRCATKGGGILATDPKLARPQAADYGYVWVRDASFVCAAADILGVPIQERFFDWCARVERYPGTSLFCRRYHADGTAVRRGGLAGEIEDQLQPDQAGTLLWAIWHHFRSDPEGAREHRELVAEIANGICDLWKKNRFRCVTFDVWEERAAFPDLNEVFVYTVAACIGGLRCANLLFPNERWARAAERMQRVLEKIPGKRFPRSWGALPDTEIDASLLGLVFPFVVFSPAHPKIHATVADIRRVLVVEGGVHRYPGDRYDGWVYQGRLIRRKEGGAWPLLNFWLSIYHALAGNKSAALKYLSWVLERVEQHIPEQIFNNRLQVSPSPLAWAHAMFVLAMRAVGAI